MDVSFLHFLNSILLFVLTHKVQGAEIYVGCYKEISGFLIKNPIRNVSQCMTECRNKLTLFAAAKDGSICYCANKTGAKVSLSKCNLTCVDNDEICGGSDFYAVYTGVPAYDGCFKDDIIHRDMNLVITGDWDMTIDKCYYYCSQRKYTFMGLQNGGSCFCDNKYGKYGRAPESECNITCTKNGNQICGGPSRSNIYSIEYFPGLNKSYSEVFHCLQDKPDRNGTCPQPKCQPGWKGTKCNHRDCHTNNGNCGEHKCEEIKVGNQNLSECVCKEGFRFDSVREECLDLDECSAGICNESTSSCNNTVGSYDCICKEGYAKDSSTEECQDVDECFFNKCDDLTSTCINKFGSYDCACKEGFVKNSTGEECEDQNECTLNSCNDATSTCSNTVGSYECICKEGFVENSSSKDCEVLKDIDECQSNPCNAPNETCINSFGSFMCICSPGYNYAKQSDCVDCNGNLYKCYNASSCQPKRDYACHSHEILINRAEGYTGGIKHKKIILIFTTFLAALLCVLFIFAVKRSFDKKRVEY